MSVCQLIITMFLFNDDGGFMLSTNMSHLITIHLYIHGEMIKGTFLWDLFDASTCNEVFNE
jgi:hypothetical protein